MYTYDDVKEHSNDREYVEKAIEDIIRKVR